MEHKKDLAKIALAALILASANPVDGQAHQDSEVAGTFLAAGCPAHGCPQKTPPSNKVIADTATDSGDTYQTRSSTYQMKSSSNNPSDATGNPSTRNSSSNDGDGGSTDRESGSSETLTEAQLLSKLSAQGKAIYQSLDSEGKALAIQLASQDSYQDKNLAIKEAQRRMNDRRGLISR